MAEMVIDRTKIADICQKNDITFLGVFGSYARGDYDQESDIDLLVRFSSAKSLLDLVRIQRELAQRIGKTVDLLTEASISPYLKDRIIASLKTVYGRT
jgi:uncharacterized protein